MKLLLPVPIRKVPVGMSAYTFENESRLVDVIAVTRTRTGARKGWRYDAHYTHPDAHPEMPRIGVNGSLLCWIRRASHPEWSPPDFPDGDKPGTVFIVCQEGGSA